MNYTHGFRHHPLYPIWYHMKERCYNKSHISYKYYGGKEISVCNEWLHGPKSFIEWCLANGWQKELQIDRIDGNKSYSPDNCQFVSPSHNMAKRDKIITNTSGYTGVYLITDWQLTKPWIARVGYQNIITNLGCFKTKAAAAQARNEYIIKNRLPHKIQEIIMEGKEVHEKK